MCILIIGVTRGIVCCVISIIEWGRFLCQRGGFSWLGCSVGGGVCAESAGCVPPAEHLVDAPPPPVRRVTPVPGETHFGLLEKRLSTPAPKIDYYPKTALTV